MCYLLKYTYLFRTCQNFFHKCINMPSYIVCISDINLGSALYVYFTCFKCVSVYALTESVYLCIFLPGVCICGRILQRVYSYVYTYQEYVFACLILNRSLYLCVLYSLGVCIYVYYSYQECVFIYKVI